MFPINRHMQRNLDAGAAQMRLTAERKKQKELEAQKRHEQRWEGIAVGDVVILKPSVTAEEYGISLTTDSGEGIYLDGVVKSIDGDVAMVLIDRVVGRSMRGVMKGVMRNVRRGDIERVHDGPANVWGDVRGLEMIQRRRDHGAVERKPKALFWDADGE